MGLPTPPQPVKLLIAFLSAEPVLFRTIATRLAQSYGPVDLQSEIFSWNTTNYYQDEMGENLLRKFVSFEQLISPEDLVGIKLETNALELALTTPTSQTTHHFTNPAPGPQLLAPVAPPARCINLDPGYLDASKLVLASTKNQAHRLYLSQGIYAEVTLLFHHSAFHPFIYTYADYRWPETQIFLQKVRKRYLEQLRTR